MKLLAHCPAQPAQRDSEQSSRGDLGSGSRAPAPASEALAASSCDCSRVLRCAPRTRRLLTCWFLRSTPSCCSGEAALWISSCSAVVLLLRGLLLRVAAQLLILRNKFNGLECSCNSSLGAERGGALRAAGAPRVAGEKRGRVQLVAQPLRSSFRAAASLPRSSSSPRLLLLCSRSLPLCHPRPSGAGFSWLLRASGEEAAG